MAEKMLRIAARTEEGLAKAVKSDSEGNLGVQVGGSVVAVPVDIQFHDLSDTAALPVRTRTLRKRIVSSDPIRTTNFLYYNLCIQGGLTEEEVRQFSEFKISIASTLSNAAGNATGTIAIFTPVSATGDPTTTASVHTEGQLYEEVNILPNGASRFLFSAKGGGVGAGAKYKVIPALDGLHSNLWVRIKYANAPDAGGITIEMEMR